MSQNEQTTKLTLRLSPDAREVIQRLSDAKGGITAAEVIRRALGTEMFLLEEQNKGTKFLLESKDSERLREVIFR